METVTVQGVSQKGKNRVRERGSIWTVKDRAQSVAFSSKKGPWLFLESLDGKACRWMHVTDDEDLKIVSS